MTASRSHINYITSVLCPLFLGIILLEVDYTTQAMIKRDHEPGHITTVNPPQMIAVQEYEMGETAALKCESNDMDHIFSFWQFSRGGDLIIGPGNTYDTSKYKYDVLTGQLFIKNVTPNEKGLYKCFSKGVHNKETYIQSVELVVQSDWEEVYEDNTDLNLLRALMGTTVLLLVLGVGYVVLKLSKKRIPHVYLDKKSGLLLEESSDEEDSVEDVFTSPRASGSKSSAPKREFSNVLLNQASTSKKGASTPEVDTDFNAVFATLSTPIK